MSDRGLVRVFDVIGSVMYDLANSIRSFPIRAQDTACCSWVFWNTHLSIKAADGEDSSFDFGIVVLLDFALLRGEAGESLRSFLVD